MNKLWAALYILAWVLLASWAAHAETPIYCRTDVVKAMNQIWFKSGSGMSGVEAAFIVNGTPEAYSIEQESMTGEYMQQHIHVYPGQTFAIFHVHPNMSGQYPSTPSNNYAENGVGDTGQADKWHVDVYVVHRYGLSVYRWQTKETVLLRSNTDWAKTKGCF